MNEPSLFDFLLFTTITRRLRFSFFSFFSIFQDRSGFSTQYPVQESSLSKVGSHSVFFNPQLLKSVLFVPGVTPSPSPSRGLILFISGVWGSLIDMR